jgi:hypothetical protein
MHGTQLSANVACDLVVTFSKKKGSLSVQAVLSDFLVVGQSTRIKIPITCLMISAGVNLLHESQLENLFELVESK